MRSLIRVALGYLCVAASLQCRSKGLQIHANTDGAADLAVSPTGGILGTGGIADGGSWV